MQIVTVQNKKDERFLRRKVSEFDFKKLKRGEIRELIKTMRQSMQEAEGIGLSANQIGLDLKVFVAKVENKFYAVFNPEIIQSSKETVSMEEGCLSVPGVFGTLDRPEKITIKGYDPNGKSIKIKSWGLLARVFQHEIDHLNGKLFIDKAKNIAKVPQN